MNSAPPPNINNEKNIKWKKYKNIENETKAVIIDTLYLTSRWLIDNIYWSYFVMTQQSAAPYVFLIIESASTLCSSRGCLMFSSYLTYVLLIVIDIYSCRYHPISLHFYHKINYSLTCDIWTLGTFSGV